MTAMLTEGEDSVCASTADLRGALERVLASPGFASKRRGELLRYLVERSLVGAADSLTEYSIALDVFRKPESFDPRRESTIRAEMSRVRKALADYYENDGAGETWRFEFPAGGYAPAFVRFHPAEPESVPAPISPRALPWAWVAAALLLCAGGLALWRFERAQPGVRSVIVLPFVNLTGDSGNDYLADGFTEDLTDALARVASLRVVARTSAFQFKGKATDVREIGRRVAAEAAVEGSLRSVEGRLLVTVQVNRTADGYHIFSRIFQSGPRDEGRIEQDMVPPILAALRPGASSSGQRTPDAEAFDLVLRARALRGYGLPDRFDRAVGLLNQAIEKDPQYGGAYAELASAYAGAATNGFVDPTGAAAEVDAAAGRAIQLDPISALAYASEGYVHAMVLGDWKRGENELRDALRLMPEDAALHQRLGLILLVQGRFDDALTEVRKAAEMDPLVPASGTSVGMVYFMQRKYDRALDAWRNLAALHPDAIALHALVGMALEAERNYSAAGKEYAAFEAQDPVSSELRMMHLLAVSGRPAQARQLAEKLGKAKVGDGLDFAATYGALGEKDKAFDWLARACEKRSCWMLKVHPFLDPLRGDARYAGFLKRAGLG
jgi:TolB-like protein